MGGIQAPPRLTRLNSKLASYNSDIQAPPRLTRLNNKLASYNGDTQVPLRFPHCSNMLAPHNGIRKLAPRIGIRKLALCSESIYPFLSTSYFRNHFLRGLQKHHLLEGWPSYLKY